MMQAYWYPARPRLDFPADISPEAKDTPRSVLLLLVRALDRTLCGKETGRGQSQTSLFNKGSIQMLPGQLDCSSVGHTVSPMLGRSPLKSG